MRVSSFAKTLPCLPALLGIMLGATSALGQISDKVTRVSVATSVPGQPVTIRVELVSPDRIDRVEIAYRPYGQTDFHRTETAITANTASAVIPGSITSFSTMLEYYVLLYPRDGGRVETYPMENPEQQPLRVTLQQQSTEPGPVSILSPEENEALPPGDVLISFFINETDTTARPPVVRVTLDDVDFSSLAVRTGNLFVVKPENVAGPLSAGPHVFTVLISDSAGEQQQKFTRRFSVSGGVPIPAKVKGAEPWAYTVSAQLESRHETISDAETPYNRATVSASGIYKEYRIDGKLYLTNEEKDDRQPQNRYFLGAESPWLKLGIGDAFPVLPQLIMNGKRVRGFTGSLSLGGFNLDFIRGSIVRRIETDFARIFPATDTAALQQTNPTDMVSLIDSVSSPKLYGVIRRPGTFDRSILIVHPIFGKRDGNHFGLTYLKSSDDMSSIRYGLEPRYGNAPEENAVLGSDLLLSFDRRNIEFTAEAAFSATNKDITSGTFTDSDIDRVFPDSSYSESNRNTIRRIRDIFSNIITVNEYLVPLGTRNMPTLAYDAALALNYFNNYLKVAYLRHGDGYESFGQSFIRTDIAGFNIADRLRLYSNQIFVSGGYERLHDNTSQTKSFTTTSNTVNFSVSYYPITQLPSVTVGILTASNDNQDDHPDSVSSVDDRSTRFFISFAKDFDFGVRHQAMFNVSTSSRDDKTARDLDTRNTTVALNLTSFVRKELQTNIGLVINSSRIPRVDSLQTVRLESVSYTTIFAGAQYRMLEDKVRFSGSLSPTFGDFRRMLVNGDVQYYFLPQVSVQTLLSLYLNRTTLDQTASTNDIVWGVTLRADI